MSPKIYIQFFSYSNHVPAERYIDLIRKSTSLAKLGLLRVINCSSLTSHIPSHALLYKGNVVCTSVLPRIQQSFSNHSPKNLIIESWDFDGCNSEKVRIELLSTQPVLQKGHPLLFSGFVGDELLHSSMGIIP